MSLANASKASCIENSIPVRSDSTSRRADAADHAASHWSYGRGATHCLHRLVRAVKALLRPAGRGIDPPDPDPVAAGIAIDVLLTMCRHRSGDLAVLRALARPDRSHPETLRAL